jgi:ribose transport system ATP-binding protein
MRDGRHVATRPSGELDADGLVRLMLGREPEERAPRPAAAAEAERAEPVLTVRSARRAPSLKDVSVDVRPGEILCFTGLAASGRRELARCLVGAEQPDAGEIRLDGRRFRTPGQAIRRGLVFLPADRKREALFLDASILSNIEIGPVSARRRLLFSPRRQRAEGERLMRELGVKAPSGDVEIQTLSGGNQQKALIARWLGVDARVLVLDEPTEGIDVGVKFEIYALLRQLAARGAAIVIFSSDYEEVRAVADRVVVLRRGRVAGELRAGEIDDETLLALETA